MTVACLTSFPNFIHIVLTHYFKGIATVVEVSDCIRIDELSTVTHSRFVDKLGFQAKLISEFVL